MLQIGTYFIKKTEADFELNRYEYALVDRTEVLDELLA